MNNSFVRKESARRARMSAQDVRIACCSAYLTPQGWWQADQDLDACKRMAIELGTFKFRFAQRPEDFFACVPPTILTIRPEECGKAVSA